MLHKLSYLEHLDSLLQKLPQCGAVLFYGQEHHLGDLPSAKIPVLKLLEIDVMFRAPQLLGVFGGDKVTVREQVPCQAGPEDAAG